MTTKLPFPLKLLLILLLSIALGVLLLYLAYLVPIDMIRSHMGTTAEVFYEEGIYPHFPPWAFGVLDNWTDGTIINIACYRGRLSPLIEAMANSRFQCNTYAPNDSIVNEFKYGFDTGYEEWYPQYWHGIQIFVKPLLAITDFTGIRIINGIVQTLLFLLFAYLMNKYGYKKYILPLFLALFCTRILSTFCCIQYSPNYYIVIITSIIMIKLVSENSDIKSIYTLFFITGILTTYFTLFTSNLVPFSMLLILFLNLSKPQTFSQFIKTTFIMGIVWLAGYVLMWVAKWLVGSAITGDNYVEVALNKIVANTADDKHFTYLEVLYGTLRDFSLTPAILFVIAYALVLGINELKCHLDIAANIDIIAEYVIVAMIPLLYIFILLRHVGIHHGVFEYKIFCITVYALLSLLCKLSSTEDKFFPMMNNQPEVAL